MKSKIQFLFALLIVTAMILAACQTQAMASPLEEPSVVEEEEVAESAEVVELVYQNWTQGEMPFEEELIAKFEESHPNIKIVLSTGPYGPHHDKVIASTLAGSPPDVYQVIPEQIFAFATQEAALDLSDFVADEGDEAFSGQYFDSAWAMVSQAGGVYGLPWRYGVSAMFINVKMFEDADVDLPNDDWTWDEFLGMAKQLTDVDENKYGFAYSGTKDSFGTSWEWFGHAFANQAGIIEDGEPIINNQEAVESLTWWANLLLEEKIVPPETATLDEASIIDLMGRGQVAMWNNGPWYINTFKSNHPDLEFVTVPLPMGKQDGSAAGGTALAISPQSKHPAEAWEFIKFMTSELVLREWATQGFFMPTRKDVLNDALFQEPPMQAFSVSALRENSNILGAYPDTGALFTILHTHMQEVFLGMKSAQEALDETASEWAAIIEPYFE